jgi:regulator of replication initiation timing
MDTRVDALISLLEDLERIERHLLHLVEENEACAIETRAYLADSMAQMQNRADFPWPAQRKNGTFLH